jgi:hypothetical protein
MAQGTPRETGEGSMMIVTKLDTSIERGKSVLRKKALYPKTISDSSWRVQMKAIYPFPSVRAPDKIRGEKDGIKALCVKNQV